MRYTGVMERRRQNNCERICGQRNSKYVQAVYAEISKHGHITNAEILEKLSTEYPNLSATTVHRITARLLECGKIKLVPSGPDSGRRFDITLTPHCHFRCKYCDELRDADFDDEVWDFARKKFGDEYTDFDDLTVTGTCRKCRRQRRNFVSE